MFGLEIQDVQKNVFEGKITSSPMSCPLLREKLLKEKDDEFVKVHFLCGFDGIKLKNTRRKVWPLTIVPLDLEDSSRASIRTVMICAIFISEVEPNWKVHDRLIKWTKTSLLNRISWRGSMYSGLIVAGVHDDSVVSILDTANQAAPSYTIPSDSGPCSSCLEYANSSAAVPEVAPEGLIVDEDFDRIRDVVDPSFRRTTAWSC
uniref:Uncharacterized protein n=1 Tax=Caenorhabditis japonica TaxID=281687 RepID=A0A8R1E3L7_CAEJA